MSSLVKIRAFKYPNRLHYEWESEMIEHTESYILVLSKPGRKLIHHTKGQTYTIEDMSLEYFSLTEWFTASLDIEHGNVVSAYCNVSQPSTYQDGIISFVDLDIDYVKTKAEGWHIVDEDEFEENRLKYSYTPELVARVHHELHNLIAKVKNEEFPFNQESIAALDKFFLRQE